MSFLLRRRNGQRKPPVGSRLHAGHPIASGLRGAWLFNESAGLLARSMVNLADGVLTNGPTWQGVPSPTGLGDGGLRFVAASDQTVVIAQPQWPDILKDITIVVSYALASIPGVGAQMQLVAKDNNTGGRSYTLDVDNANGARFYLNGGGATDQIIEGRAPVAGDSRQVLASYKANDKIMTLYVDGRQVATPVTSTLTSIPASTCDLQLARRSYAGFSQPLDGWLRYVYIWTRALSQDEARSLAQEPYQMFRGPEVSRSFAMGVGTVAPTTRTVDHTTDVILQATHAKVHTTDALLKATLAKAHATDAVLRATNTKAHTTDALLRATEKLAHTTDTLLRATAALAHTTDALLQETSAKTHTTDMWLVGTELSHTTDTILQATLAKYHTTDAVLRATSRRAHTTDVWLVGTRVEHTTDALLQATRALAHTTDVYLLATGQVHLEHSTDVLLQATKALAHTTDAHLQATRALAHTTDAHLQATRGRAHTTDVWLVGTRVEHTTDALLQARRAKAHTTDALLQDTTLLAHTTDALLRATLAKIHTTDALLQATNAKDHTTDALLQATTLLAHSTDVWLQATLSKSHTTDALLQITLALAHTTDVVLQATQAVSHTTDAALVSRVEKTHTTDALLLATAALAHTTDAWLVLVRSIAHTTDASLFSRVMKTHTTDTYLTIGGVGTWSKHHTTDMLVLAAPLFNPVIKSERLRENRVVKMYVKYGMWVIETADRRKYRVPLPSPELAGAPQQDDIDLPTAPTGGGGGFTHINEIPVGVMNGTNDTFYLLGIPAAGALLLYKNGIRQRPGSDNDYTLVGNAITFNAGNLPQAGDVLLADF